MGPISDSLSSLAGAQNTLASALTGLRNLPLANGLDTLSNAGGSVSSGASSLIPVGDLLDQVVGAYQAYDYIVKFLSHPTTRLQEIDFWPGVQTPGTLLAVNVGASNNWSVLGSNGLCLSVDGRKGPKLRDVPLTFILQSATDGAPYNIRVSSSTIGPWRYLELIKLLTPAFNERLLVSAGVNPSLFGTYYVFLSPGMECTAEGICPFFLSYT